METALRRAQRRMLQLIINTPRRRPQPPHNTDDITSELSSDDNPTTATNLENLITLTNDELLEPWPEFIRRATRAVEAQLAKLHIDDWTTHYLRRKWSWAQRIAQQDNDRWSYLVATWNPQLSNCQQARRPQARPCKRWDDDINAFLQHHHNTHRLDNPEHNSTNSIITPAWTTLATDTITWQSLQNNFIQYTQQIAAPPTTSK